MSTKPTEQDLRRAEILREFSSSILKGTIIHDPETRLVVHWACTLKANQLEGKTKKRGPKKPKFRAGDPEYAVAVRYARKKCSYEDAWSTLAEMRGCDERTAQRYLSDMKSGAELIARISPDGDEADLMTLDWYTLE